MPVHITRTLRSGHREVELMAVLGLRLSLNMLQMLVLVSLHAIRPLRLVLFLRFCLYIVLLTFTGLISALKLVRPIKDKYSNISYADLFQLASATAIEVPSYTNFWLGLAGNYVGHYTLLITLEKKLQEAGGPEIPMKYGRVDVLSPDQCPEEGRLPG